MRVNRPNEPAYAGGLTFQKIPLALTRDDLAGADVAIVGAPMDDLVSYRPGARFGPNAIRIAFDGGGSPEAYNMDTGIDPFESLNIVDHGDAEVVPGDAKRSHEAIRAAVGRVLEAGAIPVVLGGDHSIAYPNVAAVAEQYEHGSVAVVQFDTHTDTATDIWGVKYSHGSPFRHLVDEGLIPGERLIQVGIRGHWPGRAEFEWGRKMGVRWHRMDQILQRGLDSVIDDVLAATASASHIYLSVDVDVLDPAFAPGTGTPEPGGLSTRELLRAVRRLASQRDLAGMDVVEVAPPYDVAGITALAAHRVVLEALGGIALRRAGRGPNPEDPAPPG